MRTRLQTIVAARLVVSTLLLGSAIAIDLARPDSFPVNPFALLIAVTFALSFAYGATLRFVERWPLLLDLQFSLDAVLVSAFIHVTGGVNSHFSSLYVLPIIAAGTVRSRAGALQVASLSATLYSGLVAAQYLDVGVVPAGWWLPPSLADLPEPGFAQYTVAINLFGMFAVALLAGALAERLRSVRAGLQDASDQIADLLTFNDHLIDSLTSGVVTTDAQGRILTFNRGAARITGIFAQSARGADVREVLQLPGDVLPPLNSDGARSRRAETRFQPRDGRAAEIGLTAAVLQFPEGTSGYLLTFQDVTELKRLERESRLQQRRAAVGEMAAGIAHEIRNPLAAVAGSLEVLRHELPLTEEQAQLLDIALRESDHLNDRIQLFLAYARPAPAAMAAVDIPSAIEATAALLHKSVDARTDHEVVVDAVPLTWTGDEADVRQIVWSLGTNGLRAMPEGGRLTLSARVEEMPATESGGEGRTGRELLLVVTDDGVESHAGRLSEGCEPMPGSLPRGAGLGLAVVHRIATDYGGRVEVSSVLGAGTTVTVRLPEAAAAARDAARSLEAERRTA
jgi:two-component system sensor histidine kinase PilS (NtrC family)